MLIPKLLELLKEKGRFPEILKDGLSKKEIVRKLQYNGAEIAFIENPTKEMQIAAVTYSIYTIQWIKNPCEEAQDIVIEKSDVFKYFCPKIKKEYKEVSLGQLKNDPFLVRFIKHPTIEQQKFGVEQQIFEASMFIENMDEQLQIESIEISPSNIWLIQNPTIAVQWRVLEKYSDYDLIFACPEILNNAELQEQAYNKILIKSIIE